MFTLSTLYLSRRDVRRVKTKALDLQGDADAGADEGEETDSVDRKGGKLVVGVDVEEVVPVVAGRQI